MGAFDYMGGAADLVVAIVSSLRNDSCRPSIKDSSILRSLELFKNLPATRPIINAPPKNASG